MTSSATKGFLKRKRVQHNHAFTVVDFRDGMLTIINPWGPGTNGEIKDKPKDETPADGVDDGIFRVPLSEYMNEFNELAIESNG